MKLDREGFTEGYYHPPTWEHAEYFLFHYEDDGEQYIALAELDVLEAEGLLTRAQHEYLRRKIRGRDDAYDLKYMWGFNHEEFPPTKFWWYHVDRNGELPPEIAHEIFGDPLPSKA